MMRFLFIFALTAIAYGYPQNIHNTATEDQLTAATNQHPQAEDDSDIYMEALEQQTDETNNQEQLEGSQSFYPSFLPLQNPPLGHSRPFYQPEGAYSHRPTAYQQNLGFDSNARFSGYKSDRFATSASESQGLLGSGNFGVIKGGTFYNDNEGESSGSYEPYNSFYQNGHGRPSYYFGNPKPRKYQQFENFRDFADINVPSNPAYSQYVVVYANKNSSKVEQNQQNKPKNIIEHLALLDLEATTEKPEKLSKTKRKLAATLLDKKVKSKKVTTSTKELYEPLLALS